MQPRPGALRRAYRVRPAAPVAAPGSAREEEFPPPLPRLPRSRARIEGGGRDGAWRVNEGEDAANATAVPWLVRALRKSGVSGGCGFDAPRKSHQRRRE